MVYIYRNKHGTKYSTRTECQEDVCFTKAPVGYTLRTRQANIFGFFNQWESNQEVAARIAPQLPMMQCFSFPAIEKGLSKDGTHGWDSDRTNHNIAYPKKTSIQ